MELAHASGWPRLATRAPAQSPTYPRLPGWGQPGSHEPSWSSSPRAKPTQVRQKTGGVQSVGGGTATMPPAAVDAGRLRLNNRKGQVRCTLARAKPWSPLRNCGGETGSPRWRFGDSCQCITSRGVACSGRKTQTGAFTSTQSLCFCIQLIVFFSDTKPPANNRQSASSIFFSQQISTSHQSQHNENSQSLLPA